MAPAQCLPSAALVTLPNELLELILSKLPTLDLIPIASTNRLWYSTIGILVKARISRYLNKPDHKVIFECYPPADKYYTPYYHCRHVKTDILSPITPFQADGLQSWGNLYSRFRPLLTPGTPNETAEDSSSTEDSIPEPYPNQILSLDAHENFAQLCSTSTLATVDPKSKRLKSAVPMYDGVVRVYRDLLDSATRDPVIPIPSPASPSNVDVKGKVTMEDIEEDPLLDAVSDIQGLPQLPPALSRSNIANHTDPVDGVDGCRLLWISRADKKTVGLKVRIRDKRWRKTSIIRGHPTSPVLEEVGPAEEAVYQARDDVAACYGVEYQELLIRTCHLLSVLEQSETESHSSSGMAVVISL